MAKKAKKAKKAKAKAKPAKKPTKVKKTKARKGKKPGGNPKSGLRIISVAATANMMPPGPFHFYVRARVEVPTPAYTATLVKAVPQGINPAILLLNVVTRKTNKPVPEVITEVDANYDDKNYKDNFKQVTVLYGKESKTVRVRIVQ